MMKTYNSYKESGIDVLGVIPSHWEKSKFKFQHKEFDERVEENWKSYELLSLTKYGVILRDIDSGRGKFPESFETYKKVEVGDLIFCLYDIEETPRTVGLSYLNGMITGSYKIFRTLGILPKFTFYTFLVIDDVKGLKPYYTGLRNVVRPETFVSLPFHVPPLSEQLQIVEYLDTKTSQIDSLIEKTKRKIELLKEKRISLINEVVTKGLNPNVEMKDSGVEWIGEIPKHWEVIQVKFITDLFRGKFTHRPRNDERLYGGKYPFIQTGDIVSSGKYLTTYTQTLNELGYSVSKEFPIDTLVMTISGNIGDVSILKIVSCFPDSIIGFYPKKSTNEEYLYYLFVSLKSELIRNSTISTQMNLNVERVGSIKVPLPPSGEQLIILSYLDEQTSLIDKTIFIEERRIELLKEYRQSLISEVVTGKVKVTTDE